MSKILITGTAGFIFSNFIRRTIYDYKNTHSFVSIDRVSNNVINSIYRNKNHIFHIADIRDQHIIDTIFEFEKPDYVINGAACTHVDESLTNPNEFMTSNVLGTQVLINASIKYNIKKFIQISTDEVLGHLTSENDPGWTEDAPIKPRNPYSASKASAELLVKAAHESHGLTYNITRSANNYGPRQTTDKFIPKIIKNIMQSKPIPVYGQGLQIRDWTHVFDNCAAVMTVLEKGAPNEIYNISANQELPNIEIVQRICNIMGNGHNLIQFVEDRKGHDFRYSLDCTKIKKLGWSANIKLKDGLIDCCEWYKLNNWFIK